MSDTLRYDADCSFCFHHVRHDIARHDASIDLTARLVRMSGPMAPPPQLFRAHLRIRLSQLSDRRDGLKCCIEARQALRNERTLDFLRTQLEIVNSEISLIQTELETSR